jgi:2-phosphoglycerate kinase
MTRDKTPHITISDQDPGLPYSKGLMASQVMVTGLPAHRAYEVAESIEVRLLDEGRSSISSQELSGVALDVIRDLVGDRYATNFRRWQEVQGLDVPLVILIGGAVGVGKSTIATHLAHRLGIVRVVATDGSIREVMRAMLSAELMPALHVSSFQADRAVREPTRRSDALVQGFREQTQAVSVGIEAMIDRSVTEGTSIVIEGVHVVPGFFDVEAHGDALVAVPLILEVDDETRHLNHFAVRETGIRPAERYATHFGNIRKLQRYIKSQALSHGVPIVPNHSFDQAISTVLDLVMERATAWAADHGHPGSRTGDTPHGRTA